MELFYDKGYHHISLPNEIVKQSNSDSSTTQTQTIKQILTLLLIWDMVIELLFLKYLLLFSIISLLSKRNYPLHTITHCGLDPTDTR